MSAYDRIEVLTAHRRLVAHYEAKAAADVLAFENHFRAEGDTDQDAFSGAAAKVRAAAAHPAGSRR